MPDVATVHQDGSTYRRIDQGAVTYEFEIVGDEADIEDGYEYQGDGEAPEGAIDVLRVWIEKYHGDASEE